ncbi:MAG: AmmeMemoRadiSam system radical SAM enzyme [Candidatus Limnocylindrales bacterium]|jgi:pyruvate formate lyase activating enzyme
MDDRGHTESPETFTRAPSVSFDPGATPAEPVRAHFPGEEPPAGLRLQDMGPGSESEPNIRPALLGEPFDDPVAPGSVRCIACAHRCDIRPGRIGICGVRQNRGGRLYTLVYGQLVVARAEPIEKKPFYHFLPGSNAYSIATQGCNFHCAFCQNWEMSQAHREGVVPESRNTTPGEVIEEAVAAGVRSVAYTYVEPTVFIEFALDTMVRARAAGLRNVFVTNGYETPEAIELIAPYLDAANVDLKAANDRFYRRVCGARWEPVRESVVELHRRGIWVELTTLIIPGLNDDPRELRATAEWIVKAVGSETPWHLTRFQPAYRLASLQPTPAATLVDAAAVAREVGLRHVYIGNAPEVEAAETCCARCGERLISRAEFAVTEWRLVQGRCPRCGHALAGVGLETSPVVV